MWTKSIFWKRTRVNATLLALVCCFTAIAAHADPIRVATFNASLSRKGPGLLLQDIHQNKKKQLKNIVAIIQTIRPDILLINEFDHDYENLALRAFLDLLSKDTPTHKGIRYPHFFAPPQNVGVPSGHDLNHDGKLGGPADALGFGNFRGQYAMALISRHPIQMDGVQTFTHMHWQDIPDADLPTHADGSPFPTVEAQSVMRLSSKGHWDVPIILPSGDVLHILASHPTPPVFDGPEDRNGKRNRAEIMFWSNYIDHTFDGQADRFVIAGDLNADPNDGEGSHAAINALLNHPFVFDPEPRSTGAKDAAQTQAGANANHITDPTLDTADWRDDRGPGNLRVDYVLPSKTLKVLDAGVFWPAPNEAGYEWIGSSARASSDHRLVWVDLE